MLRSVKEASEKGLPIYAECGGLIYLCKSITFKDRTYPLAGVFPIELKMHSKPVGHGYTKLKVDLPNPYFEVGTIIKGHEFHYSGVTKEPPLKSCMAVQVGVGVYNKRDGILHNRTLATYTHIHANGTKQWASAIIANAIDYRNTNRCE